MYKKYKNPDGSIFEYVLKDMTGKVYNVDSTVLKEKIKSAEVSVNNLKLTRDNRLIDSQKKEFKISRVGDTIENYNKLQRRIMKRETGAQEQLSGRIENITYLPIVDDKHKSIGYIHTEHIDRTIDEINKLYNSIKITESKSVIAEEVYFTCAIKGVDTTIKRTEQIMNGSKPKDYSERMVENSYKATKYLNLIRQNNLITEKELLKTWNILISNACENESIKGTKYRSGDVQVGTYEAPSYTQVDELMQCYFNFMHDTNDALNIYVKAAILHFYLVFIHPFCDGNGRMARIISVDYMIRNGLDKFKAISLSKQIKETIREYQYALRDSENTCNDITFFVEYYLNTIRDTLENIYYNI